VGDWLQKNKANLEHLITQTESYLMLNKKGSFSPIMEVPLSERSLYYIRTT